MSVANYHLELEKLGWTSERLGEMVEWLTRKSGLSNLTIEFSSVPPSCESPEVLSRWLDAAAQALAIEIEPVEGSYADASSFVRNASPALLPVRTGSKLRWLALLTGGNKTVTLLTPSLTAKRVSAEEVRRAFCAHLETSLLGEMEGVLDSIKVAPGRRADTAAELLRQQLAGARTPQGWILRPRPGTNLWRQARHPGVLSRLLALLGAHTAQYLLWLLSWWMLAQAALQGRFDWGWLSAWALVLFAMIPFRLLVTWWQGLLSLSLGALLKKKLLFGALHLRSEELRHQGAGQLLGRVIESEAVESLALSGGFQAVMAAVEVLLAAAVMAMGPAGALEAVFLAGWIAFALAMAWRYSSNRQWWTEARLKLTNDLVERMVGHRTRLAQQPREHWHDGEDHSVSSLLALALEMDRSAQWLSALIPRGWLLLGLGALAPAFVLTNTPAADLAIGLGGVLLAFRALQRFTAGLSQIAGACIAWQQVKPLMKAAEQPLEPAAGKVTLFAGSALSVEGSERNTNLLNSRSMQPATADRAELSPVTQADGESSESPPLIEAHELSFSYQDRGLPVFRDCSVAIRSGDRLLLEGPSGGGKSTLASILAGLRLPDSGLLLLSGLDRHTIGLSAWRRRVAASPQFHENHVITATFAFNLLMGSRWPPHPSQLEEAEALCNELGLQELLARMPAGLMQLVGESGWQLSHGEKSRLYLARALLQGAELVVLDESFASLDPESLRCALACVLARAKTLLVIAHP